jgi:hypothetical protein
MSGSIPSFCDHGRPRWAQALSESSRGRQFCHVSINTTILPRFYFCLFYVFILLLLFAYVGCTLRFNNTPNCCRWRSTKIRPADHPRVLPLEVAIEIKRSTANYYVLRQLTPAVLLPLGSIPSRNKTIRSRDWIRSNSAFSHFKALKAPFIH